jgi:hypothetical protein
MAGSEPLPLGRRIRLILLGLVLVPGSLLVAYLSLFFLDDRPLPILVAYDLSVAAVPLLLFLIGLASLLATNAARMKAVTILSGLLVADAVLALALIHIAEQPTCARHPRTTSRALYPNPIDATGCLSHMPR